MRLTETTWPEVACPVLCVPLGSCEQHGPHLPLGTDTIIAEAIGAGLAACRPGIVLGPSVGITASGEHADFPGTLSIGTDAMTSVVVELVRSADWAAGVVLVNGHGGNRDAVDRATTILHHEQRRVLCWWPRRPGGDAHAGHTETSVMLWLCPELVHHDLATAGAMAPISELAPRLRSRGVRDVSPNGVLGDPTGATTEAGQVILDDLIDDLVASYDSWIGAPR